MSTAPTHYLTTTPARTYPVAEPLRTLLPRDLPAGATTSIDRDLPLMLSLAATATGDGGCWAAIGLPQLGALAAADAGLDLACGLSVQEPGRRWPEVLATVCEAAPVVMLGPVGHVPHRTAQRIGARLRRSGATLLSWQNWPGAQLQLTVTAARWEGLGDGWGLLEGRRVRIAATGRGTAGGAPTVVDLWLPGKDGWPATVDEQDRRGLRAV